MVLKVASLCMYLFVRIALRSSLRWARATYSGLVATILPFISVTAFVASSGEEKQTKPKPLLWEPSVITYRKQNVHSQKSLRFLTLKHKRKQTVKPETLYKESLMALNTSCMGRGQQPPLLNKTIYSSHSGTPFSHMSLGISTCQQLDITIKT